mgnify:CR=1 FL=1
MSDINIDQEKKPRNRREWVKTAVIILLAVLLVLTFFSNTIMNWSLPEVAAQYPQSTTLTTRIRGSGTVEAARTYDVSVQETRTVAKVNVKAGDKVAAGDVLAELDAAESQELIDARTALTALELEYNKLQVGKGDQTHAAYEAWYQAQDAVKKAEEDLEAAKAYESNLKWYQNQLSSAQSAVTSASRNKAAADSYVSSLTSQLSMVENSNTAYLIAKERVSNYPEDEEARAEMQRIYDEEIAPTISELNQELLAAQQAADSAGVSLSNAQSAVESASTALSNFQSENPAGMSVEAAQAALDAAQNALSTMEATNLDLIAQQSYEDSLAQIDLDAKAQEVSDAQEKVRLLEEKAGAEQIVSRYPGTVQTINIAAGDTTEPDQVLMVVELTERGYTLTSTVTKEQARALREGMTAEITNLWNSGITMTLTSIKSDQSNPSSGRVLTFSVQGEDINVGQQLSFSIGDKNASYDVVIPSAAIHTDANGSFVYTVAVSSSPLGNRYRVTRVSVEVIASDDTQSAVIGDLTTADFVITTATVPLEVGERVRIAEQ